MGASGGQAGGGAEGVPLFVAQGHVGRTTISCDSGASWVENQSNDDALVCWETEGLPDCDHDAGAGRGIAFGNGWFVTTFGWGPPGGLFRSQDGVAWEQTLDGTTFAGVAFGNGVFVAGSNSPRRSTDDGATWQEVDPIGLGGNARRFGFADVQGGRFVLTADGSTIAVSADDGVTWDLPSVPSGCGDDTQFDGGIAGGNGSIVVLGSDGNACVSTDGGTTWEIHQAADGISSSLVWTGTHFWAWSQGNAHRSEDGISWETLPTEPSNINFGPSAHSAPSLGGDGSFVSVRGGWQVWYGDQEFYRSDDGLSWEVLDGGAFVGSHPIRAMAFGIASPSASCAGE